MLNASSENKIKHNKWRACMHVVYSIYGRHFFKEIYAISMQTGGRVMQFFTFQRRCKYGRHFFKEIIGSSMDSCTLLRKKARNNIPTAPSANHVVGNKIPT